MDTNLDRIFSFGKGLARDKLPFSDPEGEKGQLKRLRELNQQLLKFGTVTAESFDGVMDAMIKRQQLFVEDAAYEVHCEMGSQVRENMQLDAFKAELEDLRRMKAAGANAFARSFPCSIQMVQRPKNY
jgi:phosphosulfolactate synthase (CoM biosynthesis protein A)